jgi:phosphinothricin acetyltransferase
VNRPFRDARIEDLPAILRIYAPYVENTTVSVEYVPPTPQEFEERFRRITARFPWLVWEEDGRIVAYAYASPAFERAGYQWDADLSIYVEQNYHGRGIGRALYAELESILLRMGYHNLYAIVSGENQTSLAFHARLGYEEIGRFPLSAFKHGRWLDMYWLCKRLQAPETPGKLLTYAELLAQESGRGS